MHALGGITRTIVTCFSRSTYTPFAPTGCSTDVDTVAAIKKAEELAYCKRIGATSVDLGQLASRQRKLLWGHHRYC
jgi:hypothetical protein